MLPDPDSPPVDRRASGTAPDRPHVIGWKEYLDLPELGVRKLKAKVDTGARTSALHVSGLEVVERREDGTALVEFDVPLHRRDLSRRVHARAVMLREVRVTDSGGTGEVRPVIETELALGPVRKRILLTLTDRTGMLFRMLLGRKALEGDFLVDVAARYLLGDPPAADRRHAAPPAGASPGGGGTEGAA